MGVTYHPCCPLSEALERMKSRKGCVSRSFHTNGSYRILVVRLWRPSLVVSFTDQMFMGNLHGLLKPVFSSVTWVTQVYIEIIPRTSVLLSIKHGPMLCSVPQYWPYFHCPDPDAQNKSFSKGFI